MLLSGNTELEFKAIMEKQGWTVFKIRDNGKIRNDPLDINAWNFIQAVKKVFGEVGLPDYFIFKKDLFGGGFVEIKSKNTQLTKIQHQKLMMLNKWLDVWCYVAKPNGDVIMRKI